jgi:hypothetical protein
MASSTLKFQCVQLSGLQFGAERLLLGCLDMIRSKALFRASSALNLQCLFSELAGENKSFCDSF